MKKPAAAGSSGNFTIRLIYASVKLPAQMSGSGPTLFGIFSDHVSRESARQSFSKLTASGYTLHVADTVPAGTQFISSYQVPELSEFLNLTSETDTI